MNLASLFLKYIKRKMAQQGLIEKLIETENGFVQFYDNEKNKPILILVNGLGTRTEFQWFKILKTITNDYRVLVINLLNFGNSVPKIGKAANLPNQVQALHDLMIILAIPKAHLYGISYGGLVVTEFANIYEERIETLTLISAPTKFLNLKKMEDYFKTEGSKSIHDFFIPTSYKGLQQQFRLVYYKPIWVPDFFAKSLFSLLCLPYLQGWTNILNDLLDNYSVLSEKNYTFNVKTHLIWGFNDTILPLEIGEKLKIHFRNSSLHIIPACGHLPTIEKPKVCSTIIVQNLLEHYKEIS